MRKVIDLRLTTCSHVLLLNRVMCNIAEHVQRVRTNLSTMYPNGDTVGLSRFPLRFQPTIPPPPACTNSLVPRTSMLPLVLHAPGDMAQARLAGLSNMGVIKVRVACAGGDVLQHKS